VKGTLVLESLLREQSVLLMCFHFQGLRRPAACAEMGKSCINCDGVVQVSERLPPSDSVGAPYFHYIRKKDFFRCLMHHNSKEQ
jgi:hypothetical protein